MRELIEDNSDKMEEGAYLSIMNGLKKLYENKPKENKPSEKELEDIRRSIEYQTNVHLQAFFDRKTAEEWAMIEIASKYIKISKLNTSRCVFKDDWVDLIKTVDTLYKGKEKLYYLSKKEIKNIDRLITSPYIINDDIEEKIRSNKSFAKNMLRHHLLNKNN